ncbi:MAG: 4Fe-4S dicluster domain-containing protein [Bacteroidaceae bacterium]|nr:4Fe-4S dicluster domain-containing protein [Bacteroidaceae bacterium]
MVRKIRLTLATIFFVCITLMFLDFTGVTHTWFSWMAKLQFLPAVLALNVGVIILLIALTLIFGRIYCSVICPMGVFQDIIAWFGKKARPKKERKIPYNYSKALSGLRYTVLGVFVMAIIAGVGSFVALLAPYSSYGRIASNIFQPIYRWGNNILASIAEKYDSYAIYDVDVWVKSMPTLIIAVVTLVIIFILAWRNGRTYCNTICPVGTVLGFFARFSFFHITFDAEKCKNCSMCSRNCKASCIDYKTHTVDYSRCVTCGNCLEQCKFGALSYKFATPSMATAFPKPVVVEKPAPKAEAKAEAKAEVKDPGLRTFLTTIAVGAAAAAKAQIIPEATDKKVDGGLAEIADKVKPNRATKIVPPGAISLKNMANHCTGCQLCVSACPNGVLRPSTDLLTLMQPEASYEVGYCRPECVRCSEVCPAGAIKLIDVAEKSSIQVGHAVWTRELCVPIRDGQECGNCARHCPTSAITMVLSDPNDPKSLKIPAVNEELCIGCGACENLCPSRPLSAIHVEGHEVHRTI